MAIGCGIVTIPGTDDNCLRQPIFAKSEEPRTSESRTLTTSLQARRQAAVPRGIATAHSISPVRALNAELWDDEGRRYIDFAAGIAVLNVGHCHPRVLAAVREQLSKYTHAAFQVMAYEPYVALAERLNAIAPFSGPAQTLLLNTGAEAVENAIKVARQATGRTGIVAFTGAFHGRTMLATSLTGKISPYKKNVLPLAPAVYHVPFPGAGSQVSVGESVRALELLFASSVDPEQVAAIIIEPVQGEGGFHPAPTALLMHLRELCDSHGILLIADEVQTGFGRTGRMFAIEHSGVEPDLVVAAKALGGGFPMAALIGKRSVLDKIGPGGLGSTYGGSPIGCAAALAVQDIIQDENLLTRAVEIGEQLTNGIFRISQRNEGARISSPRGMGAMVAFDVLSRDEEAPAAAAAAVVQRARALGLLVLTCGSHGQTVRLLPPLTASDDIVAEALEILEDACELAIDTSAADAL